MLLSGFTLAQFSILREKQKLDTQVQKVVQILELARSKAISGDVSFCNSWITVKPHILSYAVTVSSATAYDFKPECTNPNPTDITHSLEDGVVFLTPTMQIPFDLQGNTNSAVCFPLQNTGSNRCKYINVSINGLATSGDCTSCSPVTCACL